MKANQIHKLFAIALFSLLIIGCRKGQEISGNMPHLSAAAKENNSMRQDFGVALVKAMRDNQKLRMFVKAEALRQFDNDYDVLYQLVKDVAVDGSHSFKQLLSKYFSDPAELDRIETKMPLLTIFVPELPENSFSAEIWDAAHIVPSVGIASRNTNDVMIINPDETSFILTAEKAPGFPVVVIKENERLVVNNDENKTAVQGRKFSTSTNNFQFLHDCFDASKNATANRVTFTLDQKVIDAYNIYLGTDGWHRDYIYYGITPANPNGPFTYSFQEHITTFSMNGDPAAAYAKISDQTGDPSVVDDLYLGPNSTTPPNDVVAWTGGSFEFRVKVLFNGKNGVGSDFITYFSALPTELFQIKWKKGGLPVLPVYEPDGFLLKTKNMALPIFNWDLNQYAATTKIDIEEVDQTETNTITETDNVKFATNFQIDVTGILKKIGLKFGASLETNQTRTTTRTFTVGSDALGAVLINFADNIILSTQTVNGQTEYTTRDYSTGFFKLTMEPLRVQ